MRAEEGQIEQQSHAPVKDEVSDFVQVVIGEHPQEAEVSHVGEDDDSDDENAKEKS